MLNGNFYTVLWCKSYLHERCAGLLRAESHVLAEPGVVYRKRVSRDMKKGSQWLYVERPLFPSYLIVKVERPFGAAVRRAMARRWMGYGMTDGVLWRMPVEEAERWAAYKDRSAEGGAYPIGSTVTARGKAHENLHGVGLKVLDKKQAENGAWIYDCELPNFLGKGLVLKMDESVLGVVDGDRF